jgi:DNA (cytosine-5)-methyltransferase 1
MNELALFAGAGGGILGGKLLGWRTVCAVEKCDFARRVLLARQNDGMLDPFPVWDDVITFDGVPWRGIIDVVSGGFPCQDISSTGKGAGISGSRSGLWKHFARIIRDVQPRFVWVENSPLLTKRGIGVVLGDLAAMGYNVKWGVLGAIHCGAPHERLRIWIAGTLANTNSKRREEDSSASELRAGRIEQSSAHQRDSAKAEISEIKNEVADSNESHVKGSGLSSGIYPKDAVFNSSCAWWATDPSNSIKPELGRVANGVANWMDRLAAIGNGQVPSVVKLAWKTLGPR